MIYLCHLLNPNYSLLFFTENSSLQFHYLLGGCGGVGSKTNSVFTATDVLLLSTCVIQLLHLSICKSDTLLVNSVTIYTVVSVSILL